MIPSRSVPWRTTRARLGMAILAGVLSILAVAQGPAASALASSAQGVSR